MDAIVSDRELMCDAVYKQCNLFETLIKIQGNKNLMLKYALDHEDRPAFLDERDGY